MRKSSWSVLFKAFWQGTRWATLPMCLGLLMPAPVRVAAQGSRYIDITPATDNGLGLAFGNNCAKDQYTYKGCFDEFRLLDAVASADWVRAEYDTVVNDAFNAYSAVDGTSDTLQVFGLPANYGVAVPAYGLTKDLEAGSIELSNTAVITNLADATVYTCTGGVLSVAAPDATYVDTPFAGHTYTYTHNAGDRARLTWLWKTEHFTTVTHFGYGHVTAAGASVLNPDDTSGEWGDHISDTLTLTAVPDNGSVFKRWEGDIGTNAAASATIVLDHAIPRAVHAVFACIPPTLFAGYSPTGGVTVTYVGARAVYSFPCTNHEYTLTFNDDNLCDILVVGGGGGGGATIGGGGGAGGVIWNKNTLLSAGNYTVKTGKGGVAGSSWREGKNGEDSLLTNATSSLVAIGGGGGGGWDSSSGRAGGSGGGASRNQTAAQYRGLGTPGQGHDGALCSGNNGYCGGGGGAGEPGKVGGATQANYSGFGGNGIQCDIFGTNTWYGGGGGAGAGNNSAYGGLGGLGGGGNGANRGTSQAGLPGTDGFGGGGGGGGYSPGTSGGRGGDGIVIVSPAPIDIPGLTIFGDHNACESSPDYGFYPFAVDCYAKAGATELPLIVAGQIDGRRYVCRDYRLSIQSNSGAPASVTTNSALPYQYDAANIATGERQTLTWLWGTEHYINIKTSNSGTVDAVSTWGDSVTNTLTVTATPDSDAVFEYWTGDIGTNAADSATITLDFSQPRNVRAVFSSSIDFYVAPDGDDSASGTADAPLATVTNAIARITAMSASPVPIRPGSTITRLSTTQPPKQ
jgi:hypothetical protein